MRRRRGLIHCAPVRTTIRRAVRALRTEPVSGERCTSDDGNNKKRDADGRASGHAARASGARRWRRCWGKAIEAMNSLFELTQILCDLVLRRHASYGAPALRVLGDSGRRTRHDAAVVQAHRRVRDERRALEVRVRDRFGAGLASRVAVKRDGDVLREYVALHLRVGSLPKPARARAADGVVGAKEVLGARRVVVQNKIDAPARLNIALRGLVHTGLAWAGVARAGGLHHNRAANASVRV